MVTMQFGGAPVELLPTAHCQFFVNGKELLVQYLGYPARLAVICMCQVEAILDMLKDLGLVNKVEISKIRGDCLRMGIMEKKSSCQSGLEDLKIIETPGVFLLVPKGFYFN